MGVDRKATRSGPIERCVLGCGCGQRVTRSGRIERCVLGCGCGQKGNQEWVYREVCVGLWVWTERQPGVGV